MKNIEIKARYQKSDLTRETLKAIGADYLKTEIQTDTYFKVENGRLKIREVESGSSQIVQYIRADIKGPRTSQYEIVRLNDVHKVKIKLHDEHGILGIVQKKREIWLWQNVRIHLDEVESLGQFLELEAVVSREEDMNDDEGKVQWLMGKFDIKDVDLIGESYIDLLKRL